MKKQSKNHNKNIHLFLFNAISLCMISVIMIFYFGNIQKNVYKKHMETYLKTAQNNSIIKTDGQIKITYELKALKATKTLQLLQTDQLPKLPTERAIETSNVKMTFVGDLMVHQDQLDNAYVKATKKYDFENEFKLVKPYLENSDFTIGNLETVFGGEEIGYTDYPRFNSPDSFAVALKNSGFDLLTTANNHSNDKDEAGILRTIKMLKYLEIDNFGTYSTKAERDNIYIKEINNIKFAFLSYTYGTNGIKVSEGKDYLVNIMSEKLIKSDIQRAKLLNPDFIIVMPHMGNEYELYPNDTFKNWINLMLTAGADIVIASHPHVIQPVEFIEIKDKSGETRNCFVAYSMANFVSSQRTMPREAGFMLNLYFEKTTDQKPVLKNVSYIPTWVKFTNEKGGRDIVVTSVIDTIKKIDEGKNVDLRQKDINRVRSVYKETTNIISGTDVSISDIKDEIYLEIH